MDEPVLPPPVAVPVVPAAPTPPAQPRRAGIDRITCEFCETQVAPDGSFFELSDKAKRFRDSRDTIERLERQLAERDETITTLRRQLTEANTARESRRSGLLGDL